MQLPSLRFTLPANHARWVSLALSRRALAAVRSAVRHHRRVLALIKVDATGAGHQSYLMRLTLTA
jgi:hypothetical protein